MPTRKADRRIAIAAEAIATQEARFSVNLP
jgi:hypothetical protein